MDGKGVAAHNDCPSSRSCGASMSSHQRHRLLPMALACSLGLLALSVPAAQAHTHPTPIERAAPAVVFIEARAHAEVTLIEHDQFPDKHGVHVHVFESTSAPVLDTASGFFVDPNGTVVTTGALLSQNLVRGEVYAVNQAFARRYPRQARLTGDPFARRHIGPRTNRIEQRLQACYPPHVSLQDAGGCVFRTSLQFTVHPYVVSQAKDGNLSADPLLAQSTKEVGLLRVRSNGVPTVRLAPPLPTDYAMDVLGFVGVPGPVSATPDPKNTNPTGQHDIPQHFAQPGGPVLKSVGLKPDEAEGSVMLKQQLGHGIEGGPVVDGGTSGGQVIGLIPGPAAPGQAVPTLVGATTILKVLANAGVENRPGLTDAQFEAAMHHFKNKEYAASIPGLKNTLKQFRGHALATADLAIANDMVAKGHGSPPATVATPSTTSSSAGSSRTPLVVAALVAAALLALIVVGVALRQRRRGRGDEPQAAPARSGAAPPAPPVAGGVAPGRAASPHGRHTDDRGPAAASRAGVAPGAPGTPGAPGAPAGTSTAPGPGAARHTPSVSASVSPAPSPSTATGSPRQRPAPSRVTTDQPSTAQRAVNSNPSAGHQLTGGAPAAGAAASQAARFCTSCGARLAAGHRFCGRCGAPAGGQGSP